MGFVLVIHVLTCILLVIAILMQAGRGGGLTETFQSAESMFGTQTNAFMVRFTTILAVIFLSTSLVLALNSSKGNKSLMANQKLLATVPKPEAAVNTKQAPKPAASTAPAAVPAAPAASAPKDVPVNPVTNATK